MSDSEISQTNIEWDSSPTALNDVKTVNFGYYKNIKLTDSVSSTEWLKYSVILSESEKSSTRFAWDSLPVGSEWRKIC